MSWGKAPRGTSKREASWVPPVPSPHTFEGPSAGKAVRRARNETKPIAPLLRRLESGRPAASSSEGDHEGSRPPGRRRAAGPGRAGAGWAWGVFAGGASQARELARQGGPRKREEAPQPIPSLGQFHPPLSGVSFGCAERLNLSAACVHPLGLRPRLCADLGAALGPR